MHVGISIKCNCGKMLFKGYFPPGIWGETLHMKGARGNLNKMTHHPLKKLLRKGKVTAHHKFLQHSSYRANLNGDFLRQLETSFMDTVNKLLLLSKPKCKQGCLMIL